jgi:hypothetical protein
VTTWAVFVLHHAEYYITNSAAVSVVSETSHCGANHILTTMPSVSMIITPNCSNQFDAQVPDCQTEGKFGSVAQTNTDYDRSLRFAIMFKQTYLSTGEM